jgi:hypothetical protein
MDISRLTENQIQRGVFQHLRHRGAAGVFAFHPRNGGQDQRCLAGINAGLGVISGVPDVVIIKAGVPFALELKTLRGRLSTEQKRVLDQMRAAGCDVGRQSNMTRGTKYKWAYHSPNHEKLFEVGILADGSLYNPRGYPDDVVRDAVLAANARRHARCSAASKKGSQQATETRRRRRVRRVHETAKKIVAGHHGGPQSHCAICKRGLGEGESIARGIGSECWQDLLDTIERMKAQTVSHSPDAEHPPAAA